MNELVAALLQLTRSDAGVVAATNETIELNTLVQETIDSLRDAATSRSLTIQTQLEPINVLGHAGN